MIGVRSLPRRAFCRLRRRGAVLALSSVAFMPIVMAGCPDGIDRVGHTWVNLSCTGAGITWSAHTSDFLPREPIMYVWEIVYNGQTFRGQHGGYYTDRYGGHFRLPNEFPQALDCGPGTYTIVIHTEAMNHPNTWTNGDSATVTC